MDKIAEQKALEEYPIKVEKIYYGLPLINGAEPFTDDVNIQQRNAYIKGYDQAFPYFMEKAERFIEDTQIENFICRDDGIYFDNERFIERFKNYMQDESEN